MSTPSPTAEGRPNRLPTLFEVLSRRTLAPVDLFSFYIYMRDQQRSSDYLDFWLDVAQHMSLCRHYVRELRRSVMIGTPEGDKSQSKRSSQILENLGEMNHPVAGPSMFSTEKEKNVDAQMSAFLREEAANGEYASGGNNNGNGGHNGHSPQASMKSNLQQPKKSSNDRPRPSFMSSPLDPNSDSNSPEHTVNRADLRNSAEKILYTFLLSGAERELVLPEAIVREITISIEERGRDDPEVFDAAKDWVFQAMERDAFPGFLRQKALGNLIPPSLMLRLIIGLLSMFAAFWVGFILIFLDYSRATRCWLILPFTIGVYALCCHQYALDPILALAGYSEYTFFEFAKMKEPFVKKLLKKRAIFVLFVTLLVDAILVGIFVGVPGKRL